MKLSFTVWIIFPLGFCSFHLYSQFYTRGEDPGYLKWKQIKSDHFQVVFPEDYTHQANRITNILEFYYPYNSACLNHEPRRIPIILHNHSVLSNGFVAWTPRRMELVTTPPADNYAQDWLEQLVLHEFRHVVQVDKLNQGITKILSYAIGEQAFGIAGLMPFWFLEGDAVDAETRLSCTGRGRLPSFEMEIKALHAERDTPFSYEKAYYGSYKDHVPNYYQYGYQMVAHGRNTYGNELWENMVTYTARNPYTLYPFYFGLRKYAELSKTKLYEETFNVLDAHWKNQAVKRQYNSFTKINNRPGNHYTNYRFPKYVKDSLYFVEKSGIDQVEEFILIDKEGNEKRIFTPGFYYPVNISVSNDRIAWAEVINDLRWKRRSYSVIKVLKIGEKREKILTWNTRYFSPEFSPDGMSIIVVEADPGNEYSLVVLESETGNEIQRIPSPSNEFLQYPVWSEDGGRIFVTSLSERGKRIKEYDLNMRRWKTVFQSGFDDITELNVSGNYLLFRGTFSGIDNIYVLELKTGQCYQVTSSRYGAFHPCLSTNCSRLIYSNYTSQGFDVVEMDFIKALWKPLEEVRDHSEQLNAASLPDDKSVPEVGLMEEKHYTPEPYSKTLNLFNLHSWSPFYFNYEDPDIENPDISAGITLLSQNKLSTATTIVGYEYKEKEHYLHASFLYTGWFPAVSVGYDYGGSPFVAVTPENVNPIESVKKDINLRMKVYLPLNLTTNRYVSGAKPAIEGNYNRSYYYYNNNPSGYKSGMTFMDYRLYFYHYLKISHRDILPRWGQVFDIRYIDTPFEKEQIGSQVTVLGTLYFPGILRHHVIKVKGGYQKQEPEKYLMRNRISMPRGYSSETMLRMKKMSLDYVLPILYPDLRVWRIAYFKRIRADLFYDLALGYDVYVPSDDRYDLVNKNYYSLGFELTTDFHLMHIFFPFNSGIRFIYLPEKKKSTAEFVFSVDLNRF